MSSNPAPPSPARRVAPPPLRWRSWPMEEGGAAAWLVTAVLLSLTALVGWVMASAVWALAAGGLVIVAAWRYFVPVYFEINAQGIFQEVFGRRQRIAWRSIGQVELCRDGLLLTPGDVCCAALRGLYLPWGQNRAEVLALVGYHLQQVHHDERILDFETGPAEGVHQ
ncbi:MAG TPA: hypothetical protein PK867_14340 [Pirellulales bacterium]|nr:hypothetical protein [Pirellulales bacterium]